MKKSELKQLIKEIVTETISERQLVMHGGQSAFSKAIKQARVALQRDPAILDKVADRIEAQLGSIQEVYGRRHRKESLVRSFLGNPVILATLLTMGGWSAMINLEDEETAHDFLRKTEAARVQYIEKHKDLSDEELINKMWYRSKGTSERQRFEKADEPMHYDEYYLALLARYPEYAKYVMFGIHTQKGIDDGNMLLNKVPLRSRRTVTKL